MGFRFGPPPDTMASKRMPRETASMKVRPLAGAAFAFVACLAATSALAQPKPEAEIASLTGQGEFREFQKPGWEAAKVKQPLFASNYVRTLAMSRMALVYNDGTQEQLAPNTVIQIIGTPGAQPASARLERGRAWMQSKTLPHGMTMQTPW